MPFSPSPTNNPSPLSPSSSLGKAPQVSPQKPSPKFSKDSPSRLSQDSPQEPSQSLEEALATAHVPVLLDAVLEEVFSPVGKAKDEELLAPKVFMDLTLGWGGHSLQVINRALTEYPGNGRIALLGSDRDLKALEASCQRFYLAGFHKIQGLDPASQALVDKTLASLKSLGSRRSLGSSGLLESSGEFHKSLGPIGDLETESDLQLAPRQSQDRVQIYLNHGNFAEIGNIWLRCQDVLPDIRPTDLQTILLDLGVSSPQIDQVDRGFSYSQSAPLDMRMDQTQTLTAREILLTYSEADLVRIFRDYGEEREAYPIAKAIVADRSFRTFEDSQELVDLVCRIKRIRQGPPGKAGGQGRGKASGRGARKKMGHPAKQVFQALRIAVNGELAALENFLKAMEVWHPAGAKLLVISFQSLEDRMVKETFQRWVHPCTCPPDFPYCVCGKKPLGKKGPRYLGRSADPNNPRSESAVLRSFTFQEGE